jgi:hypothetical protein
MAEITTATLLAGLAAERDKRQSDRLAELLGVAR